MDPKPDADCMIRDRSETELAPNYSVTRMSAPDIRAALKVVPLSVHPQSGASSFPYRRLSSIVQE